MSRRPPSATMSSVGTTFGWRRRAVSRASSTNIDANVGSFAYCGCIDLIATSRETPIEPTIFARYTVAMPPEASSPSSS